MKEKPQYPSQEGDYLVSLRTDSGETKTVIAYYPKTINEQHKFVKPNGYGYYANVIAWSDIPKFTENACNSISSKWNRIL